MLARKLNEDWMKLRAIFLLGSLPVAACGYFIADNVTEYPMENPVTHQKVTCSVFGPPSMTVMRVINACIVGCLDHGFRGQKPISAGGKLTDGEQELLRETTPAECRA
jgi:hypothetical protein